MTLPIVRAARFEGISVGPGGQPIQNAMISMVNASERSLWASPGFIRPGPDGRFSLSGVTPGQYTLVARATDSVAAWNGNPNVPMPLWAETTFEVNGDDVSGIVLQFAPGTSVSGRAVFQGTQAPPDMTQVRLSLTSVSAIPGSVSGALPSATPEPDGSFTLRGIPPGTYRVVATGTANWSLLSALHDGRDTLDAPFDVMTNQNLSELSVTFTDQPTEISGIVLDRLGRPTPEYSIFIFSVDRAHWTDAPRRMSGAVKLGSDGRYKVTGLPPGEYYLSVLTDIDARQLTDPSWLEQLAPASIRITIAAAEKKTQDVRLGGS